MRPTATGRILVWRGGSLWIGLAGEPAGFHAHHAVQIALPFPRGWVRFRRPSGSWTSYAAAIVAADAPHSFEAREQFVAQLFVEPESREGRSLQLRYRDEAVAALSAATLEQERAALATAYQHRASDSELIERARRAITVLAGSTAAPPSLPDTRIARAVEIIREQLAQSVPLSAIAAAVHLSPDRFRHLFVAETGMRYRPYVLWLRLECALVAYVGGKTLTEAAYVGGFADSAHFSRTFKRMFGITPASVRPE